MDADSAHAERVACARSCDPRAPQRHPGRPVRICVHRSAKPGRKARGHRPRPRNVLAEHGLPLERIGSMTFEPDLQSGKHISIRRG